jgi:hypothetical protein
MPYIKFPNRDLRDAFYDAVNNAKTDSDDWLMRSNVATYSDDEIRYEREDVRDFGLFGEFMAMYKGRLE